MASKSKRSTNDKTKFTEAEKNWKLEKLYEDLRAAKQRCGSVKRKVLTDIEKCYLRGLLCGCSDQEIANERGVVVGTVSDALSKTLYRYIEELLNYTKEIRHWGDVPNFLDQAGYKIQVSEQSQPSHPLPDKQENTLEASHKIEPISFLEYFSKAIDQLKSKELDVRIGAISTLGTLAKYSQPAEHWRIMEYLASFIRINAPRREEGEEERSPKISEDIQAALTVIGQRNTQTEQEDQKVDLHNTDIAGADLSKAKLQEALFWKANLRKTVLIEAELKGARFMEANLQGALLIEANLQQANLLNANLQQASIRKANLREAWLWNANLQGANLMEADLQGAILSVANLQAASLVEANLKGTSLVETNLQEANLIKADLQEANLGGANMHGASLYRANLRGAILMGANLKQANLTEAQHLEPQQLELAYGDSETLLPQGFTQPTHWMKSE